MKSPSAMNEFDNLSRFVGDPLKRNAFYEIDSHSFTKLELNGGKK
jgi:hypothetical protein